MQIYTKAVPLPVRADIMPAIPKPMPVATVGLPYVGLTAMKSPPLIGYMDARMVKGMKALPVTTVGP